MVATGSVDDSDVGILCYISSLPGFRGILKQRYADFIVNEVDLDGSVVHLTSLEATPEVEDEWEIKLSDELSRNYDSEIESFRVLAGDSNAALLKDLVGKITSSSEERNSPIILSPSSDKTYRTAVHNYFNKKFKFLVTDTVDGPDASTKCIRVRVNAGGQTKGNSSKKQRERGDKPFDGRGITCWPDNVGKFIREEEVLLLETDADEQLLIYIPFNQVVKLRSIVVKGLKEEGSKTVKMYSNRGHMGFSNVNDFLPSDSAILSEENLEGKPIILKYVKFQNVQRYDTGL